MAEEPPDPDREARAQAPPDPAIERAQEELSREALDGLLAAEDYAGVLERLDAALGSTDLVSSARRGALAELDAPRQRRFAVALRDLLHDDAASFAHRFGRAANELGDAASWCLLTAPLALVHPSEHVCVHATSFKLQARVLTPQLTSRKKPTASLYEGYRAMATVARDKLQGAGLAPRDLFDVYDFVKTTLRPKSLSRLKASAAAAPASPDVGQAASAAA